MSSKLRVLLSTNLFGYIEFNFERWKFVDWWILIPEKTQEIKHCDWYYALIPCYEERCLELQKKERISINFQSAITLNKICLSGQDSLFSLTVLNTKIVENTIA